MKYIFTSLLFTAHFINVLAQPEELWSAQFHVSNDVPEMIASDHADNIYVFGRVNQSLQGIRLATVKYNAQGEELWSQLYQVDNQTLSLAPRAFAVDAEGNAIAVGHATINQTDIVVVKYSPEGELLWDYIWNYDLQNGHDNANYATTDAEANIYICGSSINTSGHYSILILKFSPQGELLLNIRKEWASNGANVGIHMALDSEGNMIVTGRRHGPPSGHYVVYKLDPEGNTLWTDTYLMPNNTGGEGQQVLIDANDHIYISARFGTYSGLQAYDSEGSLLWRDIWQEQGMNTYTPRDMAFDQEGHIILLGDGTLPSNNSNKDWFLLRYTTLGERLWHTYFNGGGNAIDEARSLAVTEEGHLLAYGYAADPIGLQSGPFPKLVQFDVDGNELWQVSPEHSSNQIGGMVLLSSGIPVLCYGASFIGESNNFVTTAYGEGSGLTANGAAAKAPSIRLYPNPVSDYLNVSATHRIAKVNVYALTGQKLISGSVAGTHVQMDLSRLKSGLFIVEVVGENQTQTFRVVKN